MQVPDNFKEWIARYVQIHIAPALEKTDGPVNLSCRFSDAQMDANGTFWVIVRITTTPRIAVGYTSKPSPFLHYRTATVKIPMVKMGNERKWWLEIDSASLADIQWAVEV